MKHIQLQQKVSNQDVKRIKTILLIVFTAIAIMFAGCASSHDLHQCPGNDSHFWAKYYGHTNWKRAF